MRTILIDVDTQHDFCVESGALFVRGADALLPRFQALVARAGERGVPIVGSVDSHAFDAWEFVGSVEPGPNGERPNFPPHCIKGTAGWLKVPGTTLPRARFVPNTFLDQSALDVAVTRHAPAHLLLEKEVYSLFANPNADGVLDRVIAAGPGHETRFIVFGVALDYCVRAAALGLTDYLARRRRSGSVALVIDGTAAVTSEGARDAESACLAAGVTLISTEAALTTLGESPALA